jgi:thiamine biosynthesis protein ThiS
VRVEINGEHRELSQSTITLGELIDQLSLAPQRIAVELNKQIVTRENWETTSVSDGDRIEIVHFVGGGCQNPDTSE